WPPASVAGRPGGAVDAGGRWRAAWSEGGALRLASGSSAATAATTPAAATLGSATGDAPPLLAVAGAGGGTTAWPALDAGGRPVVAVRQEFPDGQRQTAALTAPVSGAVEDVTAGGSGLGDALVAFRQGSAEAGAIVAAPVLAPPARFVVSAPLDWVRPASARLHWQPAPHAIGHVRYDVLLDGRTVVRNAPRRFLTLPARGLGDARHTVRVLATDAAGQQTLSAAVTVPVDGAAPLVTVRRLPGRRVRVTVGDRAAGLAQERTRIDFGDGSRAVAGAARATHRYARPGRRLIRVRAADAVGNRRTAAIWVEAR
ncbi:PKD domain-containing protein, partial [Conexibacter sp. CPCC 205706]